MNFIGININSAKKINDLSKSNINFPNYGFYNKSNLLDNNILDARTNNNNNYIVNNNFYENNEINNVNESRFSKFFQESANNQKNTDYNKINFNLNVNIYSGVTNFNNNINYIKQNNYNSSNKNNLNSVNFNNQKENVSTLTSILCTREGLHKMKNFFENNSKAANFITNIILLLNKEDGLKTVFCNVYGNYFIQEIIPKMNNEQIQLILDLIFFNFVEIAGNYSGTHCLQELLNHISDQKMENLILNSIKNKEIEMAYDINATHVLQKILLIIIDTKRIDLNNVIIENAKDFALNKNSVFVLKKFMATTSIIQNKNRISEVFAKYCIKISQSPFGNYVIQYLFEIWPLKDFEEVNNEIIKKANILACQRFSSNIIEKALDCFDEQRRNKLINKLCFDNNAFYLLKNKSGYFIINKAAKYMNDKTKKDLKNRLKNELKNGNSKESLKINKFIENLQL